MCYVTLTEKQTRLFRGFFHAHHVNTYYYNNLGKAIFSIARGVRICLYKYFIIIDINTMIMCISLIDSSSDKKMS